MSKSLGNIFDPWEALDRQGADALRWWMLTNGSPWESRRIGHEILDENVRQLLLPLWNVYGFFVTYANASGWSPGADGTPTVLDRWIRSRLARGDGPRGPRPARGLRRDGRGPARSRASSTTSRPGTCADRGGGSGTRAARAAPTPTPRSRRCTGAS